MGLPLICGRMMARLLEPCPAWHSLQRFAEGPFNGVVKALLLCVLVLSSANRLPPSREGIGAAAARDDRHAAAIIIVACLAERCEIGLIGLDEAEVRAAIGMAQIDVTIAMRALVVTDHALVVGQLALQMVAAVGESAIHRRAAIGRDVVAIIHALVVAIHTAARGMKASAVRGSPSVSCLWQLAQSWPS